jgi:NAD(P)H-dependent FMN reductase
VATIVGLAGSVRKGSLNGMLLAAIAAAMPPGRRVQIESIAEIPLYDGDAEAASGVPAAAARLKDAIAAADALLIVTPEYNGGIPGVAKNAFDWLSRPASDIRRVFGGRPTGLAGASPGMYGTLLAQNAWLTMLRGLGVDLWPGRLMVPRAAGAFDANGEIADETVRNNVRAFAEGFATFVESRSRG